MPTLEERYEKKAREAAELKRQLDRKRARERAQDEKWRTSTLVQIGGMLLRSASLDWKNVDLERLEAYLSGGALAGCHLAVRAEGEMSAAEAHAHLLEFKKASRAENRNRRKRKIDEVTAWLTEGSEDRRCEDESING